MFFFSAGDIGAVLNQMIPGETRRQDRMQEIKEDDFSQKIAKDNARTDDRLADEMKTCKADCKSDDLDRFAKGSTVRSQAVSNVRATKSGSFGGDRISVGAGGGGGPSI